MFGARNRKETIMIWLQRMEAECWWVARIHV